MCERISLAKFLPSSPKTRSQTSALALALASGVLLWLAALMRRLQGACAGSETHVTVLRVLVLLPACHVLPDRLLVAMLHVLLLLECCVLFALVLLTEAEASEVALLEEASVANRKAEVQSRRTQLQHQPLRLWLELRWILLLKWQGPVKTTLHL